MFIYLHFKL